MRGYFFTYTIINFFGRGFSKYKKLSIKNHCYYELTKIELIYKISIKLHELLSWVNLIRINSNKVNEVNLDWHIYLMKRFF